MKGMEILPGRETFLGKVCGVCLSLFDAAWKKAYFQALY